MGVFLSGKPILSAAFFSSPHRTVKRWVSVLLCASCLSGIAWAGDLINISTRGAVGTGDNVLIGGFVLGGDTPTQVIIRAPGPSLAQANVSGVLADPQLQILSGQTIIASNNNWRDSPNAAAIEAAGLAPVNDLEPAILIEDLAPGPYTAIVSGVGGATGVALIEIYR
jgi:hypothetical protein